MGKNREGVFIFCEGDLKKRADVFFVCEKKKVSEK
jgi:hypothetical protein